MQISFVNLTLYYNNKPQKWNCNEQNSLAASYAIDAVEQKLHC